MKKDIRVTIFEDNKSLRSSLLSQTLFMRKYRILICVFCITICHTITFAQSALELRIDSLMNVLKKQKDDSNKVNTLNFLISYAGTKDYATGLKYFEEAIGLSKKLNYKKGVAGAYLALGGANGQKGDLREAVKNNSEALRLRLEIGDQRDIADSYFRIGDNYFRMGEFSQTRLHFQNAVKIGEKLCDQRLISRGYRMLFLLYYRQEKFPEALSYLLAALKAAELSGDKFEIANCNNAISFFYERIEDYAQALKYRSVALKKEREIGNKEGICNALASLGETYRLLGNYAESLNCQLEALKIAEEIKIRSNLQIVHNSIARTYRSQQLFKKALEHFMILIKMQEARGGFKTGVAGTFAEIGNNYVEEAKLLLQKPDSIEYGTQLIDEGLKNFRTALSIMEPTGAKHIMAIFYDSIAAAYRLKGNLQEALKNYLSALSLRNQGGIKLDLPASYNSVAEILMELKRFSEARQYLNDGLLLSMQNQRKRYIKETYEHLANLEAAAGNWEQAHTYYKLFILYRDSINNKESIEKMLRLQIEYDHEKQVDSLKYYQLITDEKLKQEVLLARDREQSLLLKENELTLLNSEKQLQYLQLEKNGAEMAVQKAEAEMKQDQFVLLNKEKDIQSLQLKKQKQFRNYLLIGLALLLITASVGYYSYRTRQLLKLQMLRNKIASDLHDDVGSTLSSISIFSQMALQQSKQLNPLLDSIGESSRKMLDAMADIVWSINPENDQFEKIILRMRSFAYELLGAKKIDFEFVADDYVTKINVPMEVRKNLYLIFKEATNNMVKYAGAKRASFSIKGEKNNLIMLIKDNGKGFDTSQASAGNGLKNMKKRAGEMGGQLVIESWPGKGTEIQLRVAV